MAVAEHAGWRIALMALAAPVAGQSTPAVSPDGTIAVPPMVVPPSTLLSPEARAKLAKNAASAHYSDPMSWAAAAPQVRATYDRVVRPAVAAAMAKYPTSVETTTIAGVPVDNVMPSAGVAAAKRETVLINLHGGAFLVGAHWGGLLESIPVAALGGYRVISINYRMAPEAAYPAASEDVAKVYAELLKTYHARDIGIYGCSSGGTLTAQSTVWLARHGLPRPGAIGILCASLDPDFAGDSVYTSAVLTGLPPVNPPAGPGRWPGTGSVPYMAHADPGDPAAFPLRHPEALAGFPPTLFITATRAPEMSAAVFSNQKLAALGIDTRLYVFEGLWHGFAGDVSLPEAEEYQRDILRFFDEHLGHR